MNHEKGKDCPGVGATRRFDLVDRWIVNEQVKRDHHRWLIWWDGPYSFNQENLYKYIQKYQIEWDRCRLAKETSRDCGPLYLHSKVFNVEQSLKAH